MELPGILVSPQWLNQNIGAPDLVVADVRWVMNGQAIDAYMTGHIPGAVSIDADRDLSGKPFVEGPGRHPLPKPEDFAAVMSAAGIGDSTAVVVYDDVAGSVAARLWWLLDIIGHRQVALLDGGLAAWTGSREEGPPSPPMGEMPAASFSVKVWPTDSYVDAEQVADAVARNTATVIDVRAAERYRGEVEPIDPVAGHIPGARNIPWSSNIDAETKRFKSADELRRIYSAEGVNDASDVIAQCGSGLTACHDIFAMRLAGLGTARLYEGSWSGWVSDPSRPVATGA